jgi:ketosteroid isomerase-like protein
MRTFLTGCALAALVVSLAACGGSGDSSASEEDLQRKADLYEIDQIEKNFHKATSKHDIDLMMSLWAPNATFTVGPGNTATGKEQIRNSWLNKSKAFEPTNHWVSDTAAYKIRITVNGDKGTLYFECHYIDPKTQELMSITGADQEVARIDGEWLITNMVGASATLSP